MICIGCHNPMPLKGRWITLGPGIDQDMCCEACAARAAEWLKFTMPPLPPAEPRLLLAKWKADQPMTGMPYLNPELEKPA